ncbi:MAG TPA: hypothetical protein VGS16_17360 [Candidatus Dormibacteraeota bacterium]|nr:hypothetical protein [Candidatus Dormibacteraeota bacterium]
MGAPIPLRLRPLEIGDLLDETFRMYRRHFLFFAGLSVILSIPQAALAGFTYHAFSGLLQVSNPSQVPDLSVLTSTLAADGIFFLVILALLPFSYGAVTYAACESALGRPITLAGVFSGVVRRYFQLLGYGALIVAMAFVFCLIPLWIWIWVGWAVVMPVMFIENVGLGAAMGRSWRLVQGRWWRTFLILFLMFVLSYVVSLALSAFITLGQTLLQLVISPVVVLWISGATSVIVGSLVDPVIQIALVLIYFDLRVRREGLDLFQLAQQVNPPSPLPAL